MIDVNNTVLKQNVPSIDPEDWHRSFSSLVLNAPVFTIVPPLGESSLPNTSVTNSVTSLSCKHNPATEVIEPIEEPTENIKETAEDVAKEITEYNGSVLDVELSELPLIMEAMSLLLQLIYIIGTELIHRKN